MAGRLLAVWFLIVVATGSRAGAQVASPVPDPFGPTAAECDIAPRTPDELRLLVGVVGSPAARQATPLGEPELPRAELPAGPPADAATVAAVTDTARQRHACVNAGDLPRYLALHSDRHIRDAEGLRRLAAAAVDDPTALTPVPREPSQWLIFDRLHHVRVLPDGRVAAVGFADFFAVPEVYLFVRSSDRWLIDQTTPQLDPSGASGVIGTTFTGARHFFDRERGSGGYSYGVEWGADWAASIKLPLGVRQAELTLSDGVSLLLVEVPFGNPDEGLADCVAPEFVDPAADIWEDAFDPDHFAARAITAAVDEDGRALRGEEAGRAFAVYDVAYDPAGEAASAGEPYRLYLECRAMAGGGWVLGIAHLVPAAAYDAAVASREAVLATISG